MPFRSDKQRRYLFANKPEVAREFAQAEKSDPNKKKPSSLTNALETYQLHLKRRKRRKMEP